MPGRAVPRFDSAQRFRVPANAESRRKTAPKSRPGPDIGRRKGFKAAGMPGIAGAACTRQKGGASPRASRSARGRCRFHLHPIQRSKGRHLKAPAGAIQRPLRSATQASRVRRNFWSPDSGARRASRPRSRPRKSRIPAGPPRTGRASWPPDSPGWKASGNAPHAKAASAPPRCAPEADSSVGKSWMGASRPLARGRRASLERPRRNSPESPAA